MKLTPFGKMVRRLRLDHDYSLSEMSEALGISPSFASAVETGTKRIPPGYVDKVAAVLRLDPLETVELRNAAEISAPEVRIPLGRNVSRSDREMVAMFARRFSGLPAQAKLDIKQLLEDSE